MPSRYRSIGAPSPDHLEHLRRCERSAWWSHRGAMVMAAELPLGNPGLELARERVWRSQKVWAESLRELDAAVLP